MGRYIEKAVGKAPALGALDVDDPAILAEEGYLERLQNRLNWLTRHYKADLQCMDDSLEIVRAYQGLQQR